jgi:hypothetical protein
MRQLGLIVLEGRRLIIPDMLALQDAGLFNPAYLHYRRLNRHDDLARGTEKPDAPGFGVPTRGSRQSLDPPRSPKMADAG